MSKEQILSILKQNAGQYVSGEEISRTLGVTRAAVSKAVAALRKEGYVITSATNRGYRLEESPDRLTEGTVRPWLHTERLGKNLLCLDCIDSTNNYLKRLALEGRAGRHRGGCRRTDCRTRAAGPFLPVPAGNRYLSLNSSAPGGRAGKGSQPDCLHGGGYVRCGAGRSGSAASDQMDE